MKTLADIPEGTLRRMVDYTAAAGWLTNGRHDFRIAPIVANDWALRGVCELSTNHLAAEFKTTRRTVCKALRRLEDAEVIRSVGRTVSGKRLYEPCLERGDEWRAAKEARANGHH